MSKKTTKFIILACLLVVLVSLISCLTNQQQPKPQPIKIALTQDILSFDPTRTTDIFSEAVLRCVYTSLYDFDEKLNLRPKLLKSATQINDYTWRITIHDNVLFQNGMPLTIDDVIFSINRAKNGERTKKLLENVAELKKVNDTTFLISSKEPYDDFLTVFAKAETSILCKAVVEQPGYDFSVPVGAGPFCLLSWDKGQKISLERFEQYYLDKAASPYLDFVVIVTEQERTAAFLNGNVDILFSVSAYDCEKLRLSHGVKLLQSPSTKIEYLSLNNNRPPFNNPKVRLAISYAINREVITDDVYHGYSEPSASLIPKGIIGYTDEIISYDPQKAKQLLVEAGYPHGFTMNVITINTIRKNTLEYIKLNLAKIGINLEYDLVTMQQAVKMMMADQHDSILVGWAYSSDPNSVLPVLLGSGSGKTMNSSNYNNPIFDQMLIKGRTETDRAKKEQIYQDINKMVTLQAPIVILQNPMVLSAAKDSIEGIHFNSQGLIQYESLYRK